MAFLDNDDTGATNTGARGNIPVHKQAEGYFNFFLPNKGGGKRKVGAIMITKGDKQGMELVKWVQEDPEARIKILLEKLILEYNSATPSDDSAFDLSL